MSYKIAVISDIHGNLEALKSVMNHIEKQKISHDNIYNMGDCVGYNPFPNEVVDYLRKHQIKSIMGNYDESVANHTSYDNIQIVKSPKNAMAWTKENTRSGTKSYLQKLPRQLSVTLGEKSLLLTHGSPNSIKEYVYEDDLKLQIEIARTVSEDIILMGHTHYPYIKKVREKYFINVGSVGRPKDGDPRACYCILEINDQVRAQFMRVEYDTNATAKAILASQLSDEYANHVLTGSVK